MIQVQPIQTTQKSQNKQRKKNTNPEALKERTYQTALIVVELISGDLKEGIRHYRNKAGLLLTALDQIIQAARDNNLLITVPGDQIFYVPPGFARCPYCEGQLYACFRAWVLEDDGTWAGEEVELECENEPDIEADEVAWDEWLKSHSEAPYIYWLPVSEKVKRWINSQYRFAKGEFELPGERQEGAGVGPVMAGEL